MKISCPSCQKALSIDETKLPMKEVQFPCPACKARITFDRRAITSDAPEVLAQEDEDEEFAEKALIVGVDSPPIRQAAKAIGFNPLHLGTVEASRDFYLQEYPGVVFLCPKQMTQPPIQEMLPMTSVAPTDRRRGFFILVAENLRTNDGNAAFLYNVNLVVASKDLGSFPQVYRDARTFHDRLYAHLAIAD
ncbi:MAG: zinc-ribbon domain-containing protein [Thermoanaerobaculia bacterium]